MNRLLLLFLFISVTSFSQPQLERHFIYKQYTTYDGLVQSQVTHLYQCSAGYLWICTKEGVSRFDGKSFKNFVGDNLEQFNSVYKILELNGLYYFLAGNKIYRFKSANLELVDSFKLPANYYFSRSMISVLEDDTLVLCNLGVKNSPSNTYGHLYINLNTQSISNIDISNQKVLAYTKQKGDSFFFYRDCYTRLSASETISTKLKREYLKISSDGSNAICGIIKGCDNVYLFTIRADSIIETKLDEKIASGFSYLNKKWHFRNQLFQFIYFDRQFNLFSTKNGQTKKLATLSEITDILVDQENNLWVGTEDGVYNFYQQIFETYDFNIGAKTDNVWSINQDKKGTMWFSGYRVGLWSMDSKYNITKINPSANYLPQGIIKQYENQYMGSTRDTDGRLYFPVINGLMIYKDEKITGICHPPHTALYLYNDEENNRILSLGTETNLQINKNNWDTTPIPGETQTIVSCVKLHNNTFLLGSFNKQYIYDNIKITELPDTFQYKGVISMTTDRFGNIWKGTNAGLYLSTPKGEIRIGQNIISGIITSVFLHKDLLFVGAKQNLYMLNIEDHLLHRNEAIKIFDQNNGFHAMDGGQNGFFLDNNGFIWYPALDKVIRFKPEDAEETIIQKINAPQIISISADNGKGNVLKLNKADSIIQLPAGYEALRFDFFSPCFAAPDKLIYRYKLEGYSKNWLANTKEPTANFTNLKYGNYRLLVQCSLNEKNWSDIQYSNTISILPFWWQTWWTKIAVGLLMIAAISGIVWWLMKKRQKIIIKKLNAQKRLNELRLQSIRSKHIPHFSGNALANIEHFIFNADLRLANKYLAKYSRLMNITLRDAEKASRTIEQELEYVTLYLQLEKMRFGDRLEYIVSVQPDIDINKEIPSMLLQTWVENAIKHGLRQLDGIGKIIIAIKNDNNERIKISVEDNGIGRRKAKEFSTEGTGKGLQILEELISIYNRFNEKNIELKTIDLMNNEGEALGTCFEMSIPLHYCFTW